MFDAVPVINELPSGSNTIFRILAVNNLNSFPFFLKKTIIISNMDGLEWKRTKYSPPVRQFLRYAEKLAIRFSHHLVADSPAIQSYLFEKYNRPSTYIPYGATIHNDEQETDLKDYGVTANKYYLLIARIEPENNIAPILQGYLDSGSELPFLVIGNTNTVLGKKLLKQYSHQPQIKFVGGLYDQGKLHSLRKFCRIYFHGHSVGGTNPSLLEAMASATTIVAHENPFNRAVTGNNAFYFSSKEDIKLIISADPHNEQMISNNLFKIQNEYNSKVVANAYESFILDCSRTCHSFQ